MIERRKRKDQQKKGKLFKLFLFFVLPIILIAGCAYLIFFASYFRVESVNFSGNQEVSTAKLLDFANNFLANSGRVKSNLVFFGERDFIAGLQKSFPVIKTVEIKKIWPTQIQAAIIERKPEAIFCAINMLEQPEKDNLGSFGDAEKNDNVKNNTQQAATEIVNPVAPAEDRPMKEFWDKNLIRDCYFVDDEGIAVKNTSLILGGRYPGILAEAGDMLLGRQVIKSNLVSAAQEAQQGLVGLGLNPYKYFLSDPNKEMKVLINDQWTVIFDLNSNLQQQILVLGRTLKEEVKERTNSLDYLDLRVEGRAYYRLR